MKSILNYFSKIAKGDAGENEVLTSITHLLRNADDQNNFFLLQKVKIPDLTTTVEIDLLLLHPVFGIYVIEVKNWENLSFLDSKNNPFDQVNGYKNLLLTFLNEKMGRVPLNVESRVVFPSIEKEYAQNYFQENKYYNNYKNITFFKEDLTSKNLFQKFFNSSNSVIANKKDFIQVASFLIDKKSIAKAEGKIVPIITKDEILFFDHKQLSILNGYNGDFKVIRGVAGTGKTIILTNFVQNKIEADPQNKFLILCFNKSLAQELSESFDERHKKNIATYSLFSLLNRINFNYEKIGFHQEKNFNKKYELLKSDVATKEFQEKFSKHLKTHPIDYFLCDETQDMPANIMRVIYEEIKDCIFFIDEAQKFYSYSMDNIGEIFKHESFPKIDMRGKVHNLKNVYRTPSNIAKCAFEILSLDSGINAYYKKSFYLKNGFLNDISFILEDGNIKVGDWDSFENLKKLIDSLQTQTVILTQYKESKYPNSASVESINAYIKNIGKEDFIKAMTFQSVKGLEAKNIVLHNFDEFLYATVKYDKKIMYRKVYVLLTRALENIYISIGDNKKLQEDEKLIEIIEIIKKHHSSIQKINKKEESNDRILQLAQLKPKVSKFKETGEVVIVASELFKIVAGLFG